MPFKSQLLLVRDYSDDVMHEVDRAGQIPCMSQPIPVVLTRPPKMGAGRISLPPDCLREIDRILTLRCDFDTHFPGGEHARHALDVFGIALQLVKPTRAFLELWLQLDHAGQPELASSPVRDLGMAIGPDVYLSYQQHNVVTLADVQRAVTIAPRLATALDPQYGSWDHPVLPIHRSIIFFCQGYSVTPPDPRQFLWAAGLDCLYASKVDPKKWGSPEITARLEKFLGAATKPYDNVVLPSHQKPRQHLTVAAISKDVFKLRNAFAHGLRIPDPNWLTPPSLPEETGHAYQILEQTEILLRMTLVKILGYQNLFDTFSDPNRLDAYF